MIAISAALGWPWREVARWFLLPALAGGVIGASLDPTTLPIGEDRLSAVLFLDGQAYFGYIDDIAWSDTVILRDVYYLQDARATTTNLPVALVKRGGELHRPADGMRITRERLLAVERAGPRSAVAGAIAADRTLERGAR